LRAGFAAARWPGRMELIPSALGGGDERDLLLDGAHNEDGAAALAASLADLTPHLRSATGARHAPLVLILAVMADKSVAELSAALATSPELRAAQVICTTVGDVRSLAPERGASCSGRAPRANHCGRIALPRWCDSWRTDAPRCAPR